MLSENKEQYEYVKNLLIDRVSGYKRSSFQLQRLYDSFSEEIKDTAYIEFTYSDFRDLFIKECVNGKIPKRIFKISEEGFLDKKHRYPYAKISVLITKR